MKMTPNVKTSWKIKKTSKRKILLSSQKLKSILSNLAWTARLVTVISILQIFISSCWPTIMSEKKPFYPTQEAEIVNCQKILEKTGGGIFIFMTSYMWLEKLNKDNEHNDNDNKESIETSDENITGIAWNNTTVVTIALQILFNLTKAEL